MRVWMSVIAGLLVAGPGYGSKCNKCCNKCSDLPRLESELNVQEAIYEKVRQYVRGETDYQLIASSPQELQQVLEQVARAAGGGGGGSGGGGDAGAALELDTNDRRCRMYILKNGERRKFSLDKLHKLYCREIADYLLAHEKRHQQVCKQKWAAGTQNDYNSTEFVAADEMAAYWTGIQSLRSAMARIAKGCGWTESSVRLQPVPPKTTKLPPLADVPDHDAIEELKGNVRKMARALAEGRVGP